MSKYTKTNRGRYAPAPDSLPEEMHYADTGCEASASCLKCPLPMCKFDDPAWYQAHKTRERDMEVVAAFREEGLRVFEVARPPRHQRADGEPRAPQDGVRSGGASGLIRRPRRQQRRQHEQHEKAAGLRSPAAFA